ncbi:SprT-like domain-containing protein [Lacinutrix undariae]
MHHILQDYIPPTSYTYILKLIEEEDLVVKIKKERKTRHGDYRQLPNGSHVITINANLNKYKFLITLVHEIAHLKVYKTEGKYIKPHGHEWKLTFKLLMLPLINPLVFPNDLLPLLALHFKNPKASSDTDVKLAFALKQFDTPNDKTYVFEVPEGQSFKLHNDRVFIKGKKRTKRYECVEVLSEKLYLFNPNAEVELLNK